MSGPLWIRRAEVQAQTTDGQAFVWSDLRITFSVKMKRGGRSEPGQVVIYNLSPDSRAFLDRDDIKVTLRAGYDADRENSALPIVIRGDLIRVKHERQRVNWVTTLQVGDGERIRRSTRVNLSSEEQTRLELLQQVLGDTLALRENTAAQDPGWQERYVGALDGSLDLVVTEILPFGWSWMIQDGEAVLVPPSGVLDGSALVLTAGSGLIGYPKAKRRESGRSTRLLGVEAQSQLFAPLRPGRVVDLRSQEFTGVYTVAEVDHKGDTHGGEWVSDLLLQERA
jgi:hypothetical protein